MRFSLRRMFEAVTVAAIAIALLIVYLKTIDELGVQTHSPELRAGRS